MYGFVQYDSVYFGIVLLITLLASIIIIWKIYTSYWDHLPSIPGSYPIVGHVFSIPDRFEARNWKLKWFEHIGDTILLWVFFRPNIITRDPQVIEHILLSTELLTKGSTYWVFKDWIQGGILTAAEEKWRKRRKNLTPSFHFNILKGFCEIMEEHAIRLIKTLKSTSGELVDIVKVSKEFSLGIVCETSMGIQIDSTEIQRYRKNIEVIVDVIANREFYPWQWYKWLFKCFKSGKEYYQHVDESHELVKKIIEKRIVYHKTNQNLDGKKIFIDSLLDIYQRHEIDIPGMIEETSTFMFGGHDTISASLSWCLYLLGRNITCQEKAYKEAIQISQSSDSSLDDRIKEMNYIECVIKESLRIHPSVPRVSRYVQKNVTIEGMRIPRGTTISIDFLELHRDERYWENPLLFNPERFDKNANNSSRNGFLFLPFAAGQRNCIGKRYAMFELKIALYYILLNFEVVALQKEEELRETVDTIHKNEDGLFITFKPR